MRFYTIQSQYSVQYLNIMDFVFRLSTYNRHRPYHHHQIYTRLTECLTIQQFQQLTVPYIAMACGDNSRDVVDVDANISGTDTLNDSTDVIDHGGDDSDCDSGYDSGSLELDWIPQYLPWITPDVQFTQRMQAYSRILGVPLPYTGSQSTETVHQHPVDDDDDDVQLHNCDNDEFISDEEQNGNETEHNDDDSDTGSETSAASETSDIIENQLDDPGNVNEANHDGPDGNDHDPEDLEYTPNLSDISTTPSMENNRFLVDSETESSVDCSSDCKRRRL